MKNDTKVERKSDRELVVTRTFDAPARIVFDAWTKPELLKRWWAPKTFGITMLACEVDARTGGKYRMVFGFEGKDTKPMEFFGKYVEVTPGARLVWTNEESADGAVTTTTFEEKDGKTYVVVRDLYPSKAALDACIASGATGSTEECHGQLDELLATLN